MLSNEGCFRVLDCCRVQREELIARDSSIVVGVNVLEDLGSFVLIMPLLIPVTTSTMSSTTLAARPALTHCALAASVGIC